MKRRRKTVAEILLLDYVSLTELGILFGRTSHRVGRWLEALGLWVQCGDPTQKAREAGLINRREYLTGCEYPLNTWHRERTVAVLEASGHRLKKAVQVGANQVVSRYIVTTVKGPGGGASTP